MKETAVRIAKVATLAAAPLMIIWATPLPPLGRSGAPGDTTCSACHGGAGGTGKVVVTSTSGMTSYTPGASKHFTVTVTGSPGNAGFEATARPASNLSGGVAGNFVAGSTTQVTCKTGTVCSTGNPQYIRSTAATATPAVYDFDWTAPSGTENVTLYVASAVGYAGNTYLASYVLTASATPPPAPTLSVTPANLTFSYQIGGTAPAAQTLSIGGVATTYTAAASGGAWLSVSPASGGTSGTASVSVNTAGLAAGTYSGSIAITAAGSTGSPKSVPVTLNVTAAPGAFTVSPASLNFAYQLGGTAPAAQTLSISGAATTYTIAATSSGGAWLSVSPASGGKSGTASVAINTAGLAVGTYSGTVTVTAAGTTGSPKSVPVTLTVTAAAPTLAVSPASLTFTYQNGGTAPAAQTLSISGAATTYTATASGGAWLSVTPASGGKSGSVSVSVNTAGLAAGTYSGSVTITASGTTNGSQVVAVTLTVKDPAQSLQVNPGTLSFTYDIGNQAPLPFTVMVASSGAAVNYTAKASGGAWLSVAPASGATPGAVFVSVNPASLAAGTYKGSVTVTSSGSPTAVQTVPVTLTVTNSGTAACPASPDH